MDALFTGLTDLFFLQVLWKSRHVISLQFDQGTEVGMEITRIYDTLKLRLPMEATVRCLKNPIEISCRDTYSVLCNIHVRAILWEHPFVVVDLRLKIYRLQIAVISLPLNRVFCSDLVVLICFYLNDHIQSNRENLHCS